MERNNVTDSNYMSSPHIKKSVIWRGWQINNCIQYKRKCLEFIQVTAQVDLSKKGYTGIVEDSCIPVHKAIRHETVGLFNNKWRT
jgi:hypothetical protein